MVSPSGPTLRDAKRRVVAEALWFAAIELFGSRGYATTTVEDIAARAGASRRTFFRYFSTKEEIVMFGLDAYGDLIVQAIQAAPPADSPLRIMRDAVMAVVTFVVAQPNARLAMQIVDEHPAVKAAQLSQMRRVEDRVASAFRGVLGFTGRHDPRATAMAGMTLMLVDISLRAWYRDGAVPLDRIVDPLIEGIQSVADRPVPARSKSRRAAGSGGKGVRRVQPR